MTKPSRYTSLMDAPQAVPQHRPIPRVSGDQSMPGTLHAKPPQFIFFVPFSKLSPCTSSPHPRLLHAYCFLIALCASPKLPVRGIRHCSQSSQRKLAASPTAGRETRNRPASTSQEHCWLWLHPTLSAARHRAEAHLSWPRTYQLKISLRLYLG